MKRLIILISLVFVWFSSSSQTICDSIAVKTDKFEKTKAFSYRISDNLIITKSFLKDSSIVYGFLFKTIGSIASVGQKGIKVIFSNGEIFTDERERINVEASANGYIYTGSLALWDNTKRLKFFLDNGAITDFKLGIFEQSVKDGEKVKEVLRCLLDKK